MQQNLNNKVLRCLDLDALLANKLNMAVWPPLRGRSSQLSIYFIHTSILKSQCTTALHMDRNLLSQASHCRQENDNRSYNIKVKL